LPIKRQFDTRSVTALICKIDFVILIQGQILGGIIGLIELHSRGQHPWRALGSAGAIVCRQDESSQNFCGF
jgi:hypothetical protein